MIDSNLQAALIAWISNGTGLAADHIIRANQNGPDLWPDSFATFQVISAVLHDHEDYKAVAAAAEGEITITHVVQTVLTLSVNIYAPNGDQLLSQLWNSRLTYAGRFDLREIKAANVAFTGVRDLAFLSDTQFRPRFQGDFTINYRTLLDETNNIVDLLSISGKMEDETVTVTGWDNT